MSWRPCAHSCKGVQSSNQVKCYLPFGGLNQYVEVVGIVSTTRQKLLVIGCVLALGLSQISAALASPSNSNLNLVRQGDDNGPGAVYGLPPLLPQDGDDNGPGAVYGLPPLVPQNQGHGT